MQLIESLKSRVPFTVYKRFCEINSISPGHGYPGIEHVLESMSEDDKSSYIDKLDKFYREHILFGEKAPVFYECDSEQLELLRNNISSFSPERTSYSEAYPYYLTSGQLSDAPIGPSLASVEDNGDRFDLVYAAKRFFTERIHITLDQLDEEERERYSDYEEILAIRKVCRQFFDVISVPKNGDLIEVRLDSPGSMKKQELDQAHDEMEKALYSLFGGVLHGGFPDLVGKNMFPLVEKLNDSNEGRVCELGFTTDGGGVKHSKMRLHDKDLRQESYHREGSKAAIISPFRIGIRWSRQRSSDVYSNPELFIPGTMRMVSGQTKGHQSIVQISRCLDGDDYAFVTNKIASYL